MRKGLYAAIAALAAGFVLAAPPAWAQVTVSDAWVRGTVPSQRVTGAFMKVEAAKGGAIVGASSPVAGVVELHEMRLEQDVARMRRIDRIPLPEAGTLELRPGGYHLMLIDVKEPLKANDAVPITLRVEQPDGSVQEIEVQAEVRPLGGGAQGHGDHGEAHGHGHGHGHGDAHGHGHGHGDTHGHHH